MASQATQTAPQSAPSVATEGKAKGYLDKAVGVLEKFGLKNAQDVPVELIRLLEEVRHVDEARALAIANTIKYMSTFNQLVRDNVENINVGNRYLQISQMFDSIREDSKTLIGQLDDGKIGITEKMADLWMRIRRGSPAARFEDIVDVYQDVCKDAKDQLERETVIMDAYSDFRFALKEAEILARELLEAQMPHLERAKQQLAAAQQAVDDYKGNDESQQSRLELSRDEANTNFQKQDRTYQLLKDIAENLAIGYDVGETLVTKLKQTHDVKDQVYRRAVTFLLPTSTSLRSWEPCTPRSKGLTKPPSRPKRSKPASTKVWKTSPIWGANSSGPPSKQATVRRSVPPRSRSS